MSPHFLCLNSRVGVRLSALTGARHDGDRQSRSGDVVALRANRMPRSCASSMASRH